MKKQLLMMAMGLMMATAVNAQEEPKVSIKPTGRILFDGAYIKPQHEEDKLKAVLASLTSVSVSVSATASGKPKSMWAMPMAR